jgi:excisionase family DNA binding protein
VPTYLTTKQAAQIVGVAEGTMSRWVRECRIPRIKFEGAGGRPRYRIDEDDLHQYMSSLKEPATA